MPFEFIILACAVVLGFVHVFAAAHLATKIRGIDWNMGPRDQVLQPLPGLAGRLDRANHNFRETFPFFAAVALMVIVAGRHSTLSVVGTSLYLAARLLYVGAYAGAIKGVRSLLWILSVVGILLTLIALFI